MYAQNVIIKAQNGWADAHNVAIGIHSLKKPTNRNPPKRQPLPPHADTPCSQEASENLNLAYSQRSQFRIISEEQRELVNLIAYSEEDL